MDNIHILGVNHTNSRQDVRLVNEEIPNFDIILVEFDKMRYDFFTKHKFTSFTSPIRFIQKLIMLSGGVLSMPFLTWIRTAKKTDKRIYLIDSFNTEGITIRWLIDDIKDGLPVLMAEREQGMADNIIEVMLHNFDSKILVIVGGGHVSGLEAKLNIQGYLPTTKITTSASKYVKHLVALNKMIGGEETKWRSQ